MLHHCFVCGLGLFRSAQENFQSWMSTYMNKYAIFNIPAHNRANCVIYHVRINTNNTDQLIHMICKKVATNMLTRVLKMERRNTDDGSMAMSRVLAALADG